MADIKSPTASARTAVSSEPAFLREEEVRQGIELLFFAYRDFTAEPDAILEQYGFGRAHHRVVHFVGRHPQMTVGELLGILRINKQGLTRGRGPPASPSSSAPGAAANWSTASRSCSAPGSARPTTRPARRRSRASAR